MADDSGVFGMVAELPNVTPAANKELQALKGQQFRFCAISECGTKEVIADPRLPVTPTLRWSFTRRGTSNQEV